MSDTYNWAIKFAIMFHVYTDIWIEIMWIKFYKINDRSLVQFEYWIEY